MFFEGRAAIIDFLTRKWSHEREYRLHKELWCFTNNRISVRFEYESRDRDGQWWRSHGNEHWEFDASGLMSRRDASINDYRIDEGERRVAVNDADFVMAGHASGATAHRPTQTTTDGGLG